MKKSILIFLILMNSISFASVQLKVNLSDVLTDELSRIEDLNRKVSTKLFFYKAVDSHLNMLQQNGREITESIEEAIIIKYYPIKTEEEAWSFCYESQKIYELKERVMNLLLHANNSSDSEVDKATLAEFSVEIGSLEIMACGSGYRLTTLDEVRNLDFYDGIVDFYKKSKTNLKHAVEKIDKFESLLRSIIQKV